MALIECSECGNQVSDKASACPKCGNPIAPIIGSPAVAIAGHPGPTAAPKKKPSFLVRIFKWIGIAIAAFVVLAIYVASQAPSRPKPSPGYSAPSTEPPPLAAGGEVAPISVQAAELYADYDANEVAADNEYKGKRMSITGTVVEISKDFMDEPYLQLYGKNQYATVRVSFPKSRLDELAKLKKGDNITVSGCVGKGKIVTSPVVDCR